jgi:hypothetical protein
MTVVDIIAVGRRIVRIVGIVTVVVDCMHYIVRQFICLLMRGFMT